MASILSRFIPKQEPPEPIPPGIYHYQAPADSPIPYRLHLRVEPDGSSLMIVNASTVLHLNESATAHAFEIIQGKNVADAAKSISHRYRVSHRQAMADQEILHQKIVTIATFPDVDPVSFLGMERSEPYAHTPSAPYRLDIALTYFMDPDGALDPLARARVDREFNTDEWKRVLDIAWEKGIPHVTFTGGEPTRRPDLIDLIQHAESLGQVTGLLTAGHRLASQEYVDQLAQAGLDHLLITPIEEDSASLEGLHNALASDIFTAVHLTITNPDLQPIADSLNRLDNMGLSAISLSVSENTESLASVLAKARDLVADLGMELIWNLPAPYSTSNPISLELEQAPQGAGRAWLYIEPDGDILPTQGVNKILGNILRDSWDEIWKMALAWPSS